MLDSPMIDVALGLMLFFLVMALAVTAIQGWISNFFKLRGKNLRKGIEKLTGSEITEKIYDHPLMKTMGDNPSYLKSKYFSKILIDIIDPKKEVLQDEKKDIKAFIDKIPSDDLKETFRSLNAKADDLENQISDWFDTGMERASGWYQKKMQFCSIIISAILVVVLNADTLNIAKALFHDDALRAKANAIVDQISKENPETSEEKIKSLQDLKTQIHITDFPIGWSKNPLEKFTAKGSEDFDWSKALVEGFKRFFQCYWLIILIGIIGWLILYILYRSSLKKKVEEKNDNTFDWKKAIADWKKAIADWKKAIADWKKAIAEGFKRFFQCYWLIILVGIIGWLILYLVSASWINIIGWLITISAVSLGAPFWFDLIGKVANIRNSVKPKPKEEKKDSNTKPHEKKD